ncbi:MAG: flavodoxin family protein [Burkholderiales bacterium]
MKKLLLVWHSQFGGTAQMAAAARDGAAAIDGIEVAFVTAKDAGAADLRACDGLLVATSENFGSLAGVTKDFFERVFYPCEHDVAGRPYSVIVCAGTDGTGAMRDVDRIATGLRMKKVLPGVTFRSGITAQPQTIPADVLDACATLGATLAAGIVEGLY